MRKKAPKKFRILTAEQSGEIVWKREPAKGIRKLGPIEEQAEFPLDNVPAEKQIEPIDDEDVPF